MYGPGGRRGRSGPWPQASHVSGHELQLAVMSQRWWLLMLSILFISFCDWLRFRHQQSDTPGDLGDASEAKMCSYTESCAWATVSICRNCESLWYNFILLYLYESKLERSSGHLHVATILHTNILHNFYSQNNNNSFRMEILSKRYSIWTSFAITSLISIVTITMIQWRREGGRSGHAPRAALCRGGIWRSA